MTIGRRKALRQFGAAALGVRAFGAGSGLLSLAGCSPSLISLGPWPCRPTSQSMSIWCEAWERPSPARVLDGEGRVVGEARFEAIGDDLHLATLDGLSADTEYRFSTRSADGSMHRGSFRTMPSSTGRVRLAIGADIHPASAPHVAFDHVMARQPHLFVGLGDQVYADLDVKGPIEPTHAAYEELYRRTWSDASLAACWANVPTLLVWDDHETWNDFDNSFDPVRALAARDTYERMQRSRSPSENAWAIVEAGPASIFILDTRSFRHPNAAPDGPDKTMLGVPQREALFAWLARSSGLLRIIASPTAFHRYADTGVDAWAHGFAFERDLVLEAIAVHDPESVLIVSGDLHWPAVVEVALPSGSSVLELGCTPIAAFTRPAPVRESLGSDVLFIGDGERGFGWLEVDGGRSPATVSFAWVNQSGEELYTWEGLLRPARRHDLGFSMAKPSDLDHAGGVSR